LVEPLTPAELLARCQYAADLHEQAMTMTARRHRRRPGARAAAGKAAGEIGKGIGTMLMAGMAVGIATNAAYTKHAMDAINVTISDDPVKALLDDMTELRAEVDHRYRTLRKLPAEVARLRCPVPLDRRTAA